MITAQQPVQNKPQDYRLLKAWHKSGGSLSYYWACLQEKAAEENAPLDSIYKNSQGEWVSIDACTPEVKDFILSYEKGMV